MFSPQPQLDALWKCVQGRTRPEEAADACLQLLGEHLSRKQKAALWVAAKFSFRYGGNFGYSSMSDEFAHPVGFYAQVQRAAELFPTVPQLDPADDDDIEAVSAYLVRLNTTLHKPFLAHDFKGDRLAHAKRVELGLEMSRRQYNRAFRYLSYLEEKFEVFRREWRKYEFTRVSKTKLAIFLARQEFERDLVSACFIAYYSARCNKRSIFTNGPQERPFDSICATLFEMCRTQETTNWYAIAHIFPDAEVLSHLSDEQKGALLGRYAALMSDVAALLKEVWQKTEVNLETMIVRRGNDSTTWNNTAGAWNRTREGWFALLEALDLDAVLDAMCPGKVPRLMAADVAHWHRVTGGQLHPDTHVWAQLPFPWEVFSGEVACPRSQVEQVCAQHGLDAEKSGWTKARPRANMVSFRPTPELVHGVTVWHPALAQILRDMGVYSGKPRKMD